MKKEQILLELEKIRKSESYGLLSELINDIKKDIRVETSYKSNSKSKVNAIKKVCKLHEKNRPILSGYNINEKDGLYEFTDSYQAYRIKPTEMPVKRVGIATDEEKEKGIDTIQGDYPNIDKLFYDFDNNEIVKLDIDDIMYHYKIRNKKQKDVISNDTLIYELKSASYNVYVNIEYLKNVIDILGQDIECCLFGEVRPVLFMNEENEQSIILSIKKRG